MVPAEALLQKNHSGAGVLEVRSMPMVVAVTSVTTPETNGVCTVPYGVLAKANTYGGAIVLKSNRYEPGAVSVRGAASFAIVPLNVKTAPAMAVPTYTGVRLPSGGGDGMGGEDFD